MATRALLAKLDSLQALQSWRDFVIRAKRQQPGNGGCPLGSLSGELSDHDAAAREVLSAGFSRWADALQAGLTAMVENGALRAEVGPRRSALALLAALQGGLLLAQAQHNTDGLEAGLDVVIDSIRGYAVSEH